MATLKQLAEAAHARGGGYRPQSIPNEPYPSTVQESLRNNYKFKKGVIAATKALKAEKPWRGSIERRFEIYCQWIAAVSACYDLAIPTVDNFLDSSSSTSGRSHYIAGPHKIRLVGKPSVITLFHEMAHALGRGEQGACRWSLNLFRRVFPRQFARLNAQGHTLVR